MKKVAMLVAFGAMVGFSSCGEAEPTIDENLVKETLDLQNEVDAVNEELEELNEADLDLEESLEELNF